MTDFDDLISSLPESRDDRRKRFAVMNSVVDYLAEEFGQANWQQLRHRDPEGFFRAKIDIVSGPDDLSIQCMLVADGMRLRFDYTRAGERRRIEVKIGMSALRDEPEVDDVICRALTYVAGLLSRDSGIDVQLRLRSNREAADNMIDDDQVGRR